jgi:hypothetical protein
MQDFILFTASHRWGVYRGSRFRLPTGTGITKITEPSSSGRTPFLCGKSALPSTAIMPPRRPRPGKELTHCGIASAPARDFPTLVRQYPDNAIATGNDGPGATFPRGELAPAIEDVMFSQGLGFITEPIRPGEALEILRIEERTKDGQATFDEARDEINV